MTVCCWFASKCVQITLMYNQFLSSIDQTYQKMWNTCAGNAVMPFYQEKQTLWGTTQHHTGLDNNVTDVIYVIFEIYVYIDLCNLRTSNLRD